MRTWAPVAAGIVAAAALTTLVRPGYDTSYALAWGRDLAHGLPLDFSHPSSPTPHPLTLAGTWLLGFTPDVAGAVTAVGTTLSALVLVIALAVVARDLTDRRTAALITAAVALSCAPLGLLVLGAGIDVGYCAIAVVGVILTIRGRPVAAVSTLCAAALLRPEALVLAVIPVVLAARSVGGATDRRSMIRSGSAWVVGGAAVGAAWIGTGMAGGDALIALHSAAGNAALNDNPTGFGTALVHLPPDLASVTGPITLIAAAWACFAARRSSLRRPGRAVRASASQVLVVGLFVAGGAVLYLVQGLLGTPLVARYLLLPGLLCVPLAACTVIDLGRRARSPRGRRALEVGSAVALIASAAIASAPGWRDVTGARDVRAGAFSDAAGLLGTPLARQCDAPFVVRSPAMVPVVALRLDRALAQIDVADEPGDGVLLQPLTHDAAELAGFGPMTATAQQARFPEDAPPRTSSATWALYSRCQP